MVELIRYNNADKEPIECMQEMKTRKNCTIETIPQTTLKKELRSWNHFFKGKKFLDILEKYNHNSETMGIYSDDKTARNRFKSEFWFDIWYNSDGKYKGESQKPSKNYFYQPHLINNFYVTENQAIAYYEDDRTKIKLLQASRGYHLLDSKYKIFWSTARTTHFYHSDDNIILWGQDYAGIGSDNRDEILYLFILLNSKLTWEVIKSFVQPDNEDKFHILVQLATLKGLIRVPIITEQNQHLKDRLIEIAQNILDAEKPLFKDVLDLSHILVQKFTSIEIVGDELVFTHGIESTRIKITTNIERIAYNLTLYLKEMKRSKQDLSLLTFKNFPCVDNILIAELMQESNTIIYQLYGMDEHDIRVIEG